MIKLNRIIFFGFLRVAGYMLQVDEREQVRLQELKY